MKKDIVYPLLVVLLFVAVITHLMFWQLKNNNYFNYDSFRHYVTSVKIFDEFAKGGDNLFSRIQGHLNKHPPGVYLITSLFYYILAPTQESAALINTSFFVAPLFFSLYQIGVLIADGRTGLLSCAIVILYPVVFNQAKIYMLDLPLLSLVTLTVYCLMQSDYFRHRSFTILFLLSFLAGLLIKLNFLCFTVGPLLYCLIMGLQQRKIDIRRILLIVFIVVGVIAAYYLQSPSYMQHIFKWLSTLKGSGVVITSTPPHLRNVPLIIHKIRAPLWYVWGFINWQGSMVAFIAFIGGLFAFVKSTSRHKPLILVWLASSYILLCWFVYAIDSDMEVTGVRYSMPLLGCVALISAYGLLKITIRNLRIACVSFVILLASLQAAYSSHPLLHNHITLKINIPQDRYHILPSYLVLFSTEPVIISGSNWTSVYSDQSALHQAIEDVYSYVNSFHMNRPLKILLLSDNAEWWHLQYLAYRNNKALGFFCDYDMLAKEAPFFLREADYFVREADFVIEIKNAFTEAYLVDFNEGLKSAFYREKTFQLIREDDFCRIFKREP